MALFSAFGPCAKFLAPAKTASGHWGNCRLAFLTLSSSHSDPQQSLAYLVGWRHFSHRVTSYSRDIAFAGRLEAGRKDHGFTPLVDRPMLLKQVRDKEGEHVWNGTGSPGGNRGCQAQRSNQ